MTVTRTACPMCSTGSHLVPWMNTGTPLRPEHLRIDVHGFATTATAAVRNLTPAVSR